MATKFNRYQAGNTFVVPAGTRVKVQGGSRTQQKTRLVTVTGIRSTRNAVGVTKTEILWKSNGYTAVAAI